MITDTGCPPVVRLLSDAAVLPRGGCPAYRRVRADRSAGPERHRPGEVPAAVLHAVLDLVEHRGWSLERACAHPPPPGRPPVTVLGDRVPPVHEGVRRWVHHAAGAHLAAVAGRTPVPDFWVRQYMPERDSRHRRPYEVRAAGRCYTRDTARELWVPVPGGLRRSPADAGVAVAAYVLATGSPVDRRAYAADPARYHGGAPYPMLRGDGPPERVRVVRVSCLDGAAQTRFDGTAEEAVALFAERGREGLRSALVGGARVPGPDCLTCGIRSGCGRLPRAPGLLGLGRAPERRAWSPDGAREHALCPARAHFRALGLPAVHRVPVRHTVQPPPDGPRALGPPAPCPPTVPAGAGTFVSAPGAPAPPGGAPATDGAPRGPAARAGRDGPSPRHTSAPPREPAPRPRHAPPADARTAPAGTRAPGSDASTATPRAPTAGPEQAPPPGTAARTTRAPYARTAAWERSPQPSAAPQAADTKASGLGATAAARHAHTTGAEPTPPPTDAARTTGPETTAPRPHAAGPGRNPHTGTGTNTTGARSSAPGTTTASRGHGDRPAPMPHPGTGPGTAVSEPPVQAAGPERTSPLGTGTRATGAGTRGPRTSTAAPGGPEAGPAPVPAPPPRTADPLRAGDGVVAGAVRAWLERAHGRPPRRACEPADLPPDPARWACGGRRLFGERARRAAALLAAHLPVCPLRDLPAGDHVRSGSALTADDTDADVLLVHRADVLHHRRGSWVHRSVLIPEDGPPGTAPAALFAQEPRAALGVLLFSSGVIAAGPEPAVEVEVLTPGGARVHVLDPASPPVLAAAERTVRDLAAPWHRDLEHAPVPGPACRTCPYRAWCPRGEDAPP
ncbi:PD-(D/E)XK nuclease family protein [Nocardiopsis flavescens]